MTAFVKESKELIFSALDAVMKLAVAIHQEGPLAFSAYSAFVPFPRMILRSLPPECEGRHASLAFEERYGKLMDGRVSEFIREAHESQVTRVARRVNDATLPSRSFSLAARAATLACNGAVGKTCKLAFPYGTETGPDVAATFLAKLTRSTMHTHVLPLPSAHKSDFVPIL